MQMTLTLGTTKLPASDGMEEPAGEGKTEFTHIHLANADQKENNGKAVRGNEH